MKKLLLFLVTVLTTVAAYAFDLSGRTYRSNPIEEQGVKCDVTLKFNANGTCNYKFVAHAKGHNPVLLNGTWYVRDGENVITNFTGNEEILIPFIAEETGEICLMSEELNPNGKPMFVFREVKSTPKKNTTTKKAATRKK